MWWTMYSINTSKKKLKHTFVDCRGGSRISQKGAPTPEFGVKTLFSKIFAENCMEMKEIGPTGESVPGAPLDMPMDWLYCGTFIWSQFKYPTYVETFQLN